MLTQINTRLALALLLTVMAGCATELPGVRPAGATAMSGTEVVKLIERAVAEGRVFDNGYQGGLSFAFRPDGRLDVTSRFVTNKTVAGRWRVDAEGGRLCTRFEPDPATCAAVYRLSIQPERLYVDVEGGTQRGNTFVMR